VRVEARIASPLERPYLIYPRTKQIRRLNHSSGVAIRDALKTVVIEPRDDAVQASADATTQTVVGVEQRIRTRDDLGNAILGIVGVGVRAVREQVAGFVVGVRGATDLRVLVQGIRGVADPGGCGAVADTVVGKRRAGVRGVRKLRERIVREALGPARGGNALAQPVADRVKRCQRPTHIKKLILIRN